MRHNALRNKTFRLAVLVGANPELEKAGLLLPERPGDCESQRRPADIYLPAWDGGIPVALDFAVTAPQRQDILRASAAEPLAAASAYSATKRDYKDTAAVCASNGVTFQPMVVESSGAWSAEALAVLRKLANAAGIRTGKEPDVVLREFLEGASVAVRRANARAHIKRRAFTAGAPGSDVTPDDILAA